MFTFRWQQNLIGLLAIDIASEEGSVESVDASIILNSSLGYRNKGDSEDEWKEYASSLDNRSVHCKMDRNLPFYNCSTQRLFDLGSLYHDYYLLNIRILDVMCPSSNNRSELIISNDFGKFVDLWLVTNIQNGGFTMLWLSLKSMFFLVISLAVIYYWKKVSSSGRPSHLLEKKLMVLSCSLILLNFPLEYFTLAFNLPWIYLFINFFQVIFYVNLLFFLFLFTAEAKAQDFLGYWKKSLTIAMIGCISIIIMDAMVGKAVVQSVNPFYASSAWFVTSAANVELAVTVITSITGLIFLFISLMMCFQMITKKYPEESWRMTLMMLITILIPVMTLVEFLISKAAEGTMKWNETLGEAFKYTSGLKTGVLGLWNIYTFALLILLVPLNNQK